MGAFAAGDALGVPWEGRPPSQIAGQPLWPLRARDDWPRGATSDDTAQLLLMARALASGAEPAEWFMDALAREADGIRGMGPSSLAAVQRYRLDGSLVAAGGATNGALMRVPAIGWGARDLAELASLVEATTRTTHGDAAAVEAATRVALAAFRALEGERPARFEWNPPADGVSMQATESADAALWVASRAESPAEAAQMAVRLGGDTDTIAAIAAGIAGSLPEAVGAEIEWLDEVLLPDGIGELAEALGARRSGCST